MRKFIIYKASGGLSHNFNGLSLAIHMAVTQNRILCINMIHHPQKNKGIKFSDFFIINNNDLEYYDEDFSKIPNCYSYHDLSVDDIINNIRSTEDYADLKFIFSIFINDFNLVVYTGNGRNDIPVEIHEKLNQEKLNIKVNDQINKRLKNEIKIKELYISMHFRNTDIQNNIKEFIKKIRNLDTNIKTLYLASDDNSSYHILKKELSDFIIIRNTIPPENIRNLHYSHEAICNKSNEVYNCLRDIYFILNSIYFIPSKNSGLSKYIISMIKNKNYLISGIDNTPIII